MRIECGYRKKIEACGSDEVVCVGVLSSDSLQFCVGGNGSMETLLVKGW